MNATTLQCHSCGAAVTGQDPACGHCGARLATVSCPACFSMMFREARFCPACGSAAAQWEASPTNLPCPSCREAMLQGTLGKVQLHECPRCFGLWLDTAMFEFICRQAERQATTLGLASPVARNQAIEPVRYRPCPACQQFMNRLNFARSSGVIVDVCRAHGTWFDADELHRIVQFIHQGGLDRARDREKSDLAEERRRLIQARAANTTLHDRPVSSHAPDLTGSLLVDVVAAAGSLITHWLDKR